MTTDQPTNPLVGRYFHTFKDDARTVFYEQGYVIAHLHDDTYLVELFEWTDGYQNGTYEQTFDATTFATFYDSAQEMNAAYYATTWLKEAPPAWR